MEIAGRRNDLLLFCFCRVGFILLHILNIIIYSAFLHFLQLWNIIQFGCYVIILTHAIFPSTVQVQSKYNLYYLSVYQP